MSLDIAALVRELRRQKRKYHAKVLSDSAIDIGFARFLDIEDWTAFFVWLTLPEFNFSAFGFSMLFDAAPITFEPINIDFIVDLPTPEEFAQGILIDIRRWNIAQEFPWLESVDDFIDTNVEEAPASDMKRSRLQKGVYGRSRYGLSYYDPPTTAHFLRSTLLKMWLTRYTLKQLRDDFEAVKASTRASDVFIRHVFNRISMMVNAHRNMFILGYGVLGYSYLGKKPEGEARGIAEGKFVDYDLQVRDFRVGSLDHIQCGFILDVTPLNMGFLMPEESVYKKVERELPARVSAFSKHPGSPEMARFIERKALRIRFTLHFSPWAFANYQRLSEIWDWKKSERADQWMTLQMIRYLVENMVEPIILKHESNPVRIRMYKSAALQLVSAKTKRHGWGYLGFKAMSEEEFRRWWLDHWSALGLKREVLEEIYNRVKPCLQHLRALKLHLGKRLRETRYRLAQLSK